MIIFFKKFFGNKVKTQKSIWDRDFSLKFLEIAKKEAGWETLEANLEPVLKELAKSYSEDSKKNKAETALMRFYEFYDRLVSRYAEVRRIEWEMYYLDQLREKRTMKEIQSDFVNKTESFHQQIYASVSALIKLLSHVAPENFIKRMPSARATNFLSFVEKEIPTCKEDVKKIQQSLDYRADYIDHTNQKKLHNWYTYSNVDGKSYIIYYRESGQGDFLDLSHIAKIPMKSPFRAKEFFVPPHHSETLSTLKSLMVSIFKSIR